MTTEQLDYLLGLARDLGAADARLAAAERAHASAARGDSRRSYEALRSARAAQRNAEMGLARARRNVARP